jgi:peptidoglycan/xylan/chitin deacetylase (PgdA/CDA1 family)
MSSFPSVLMLHHVEALPLDPSPLHPDSYLDREEFRALLDLLAERGFATLTLAEAVERVSAIQSARHGAGRSPRHGAGRLPRRSVVLTFDDGCRCFRDHAWPELAARGMTATLFAVAGELGGANRWDLAAGERREELLGAGDLARLAEAGVEIGSHGLAHRDLTALDAGGLREETAGSRAALEAALGRPVATFCYPYGRLDAPAEAAVRAAGYSAAVSIHGYPGARPGDLHALPRMIVNPGESRFERLLKARGLYPLWSRLPRLGLLGALRRGEPR